jgi:hypothetical protein
MPISRAKLPGYVPVSYDEYDAGPEAPVEPAAGPSAVETTQIQPPEQPRGPHRAPARTPHAPHEPIPANRPQGSKFGAGIFE